MRVETMNKHLTWIFPSILILATLFLSACASFGKPSVNQISLAARDSLESGDFQKAIDSFQEPYQQNPGDKRLEAGYARALEDIHLAAETALADRDYPRAGDIYRVLIQNFPSPGDLASRLPFTKAALEGKLKNCRSVSVDLQYRRHLKDGRYASALDSFAALLKDYPRDTDIAAGYVKAGKEIKDAGDRALAANDFALAGKAYSALKEKCATFTGFQPAVGFSWADLERGISVCRTTLKNSGFTEYRKGNLDKAVTAWEELLAFDPENAEIRKAVETAKSQAKRLKK